MEAWIDLAEPIPYSRLRATFPAGGGLRLERLKVNQPIPPVALQFPKFDEEGVAVPSARSVSSMEDAVQAMRLSPWTDWLIRLGMKDPEWRTKAETSLGRPIDWSGVASHATRQSGTHSSAWPSDIYNNYPKAVPRYQDQAKRRVSRRRNWRKRDRDSSTDWIAPAADPRLAGTGRRPDTMETTTPRAPVPGAARST